MDGQEMDEPVAGPSRRKSLRIQSQRKEPGDEPVHAPKTKKAQLQQKVQPESKQKQKLQQTTQKNAKPRKANVPSDISEELVDDPGVEPSDGTPVALSGASVELPHSALKKRPTAEPTLCLVCKKTLSSRSRLKTHLMRHKIDDVNARKIVNFDDIHLEAKAIDVLSSMSKDRGEGKKEFIDNILSHAVGDRSQEWKQFVADLIKPMLDSFIRRCSAMPTQHYEEQHRSLNIFLNDESETSEFISLVSTFNQFSDNSNDKMSRNVLTRLCFKLLDAMLQLQFEAMKAHEIQLAQDVAQPINKDDFEVHLRKFFQMYYLKGVKSASSRVLARCACIRLNFIDAQCDLDRVELITNNSSWQPDINGVAKLKLKERVIEFFLSVEEIVRSNPNPKPDNVINVLLERSILLEPWYFSTSVFGEEEALVFLSELLPVFIKLSLKLRNKYVRESQGLQKVGQYAHNLGLKRN